MKNWLSGVLHTTSTELFRTCFGLTKMYYIHKQFLLWGVLAAAALMLLLLFGRNPSRRELFRKQRIPLLRSLLQQSGIVFFGGGVLYLLQVLPAAKCTLLPLLVGLYGSLVLLSVTVWQFICYPFRRYEILTERFKNYSVLLFLDLLFLSALGQLDLLEFLAGLALITLCKGLVFSLNAQQHEGAGCRPPALKPGLRNDLPVEDGSELFASRNQQLTALVKECKDWPDEPYAVLLSAPWGFGKTSFIHAFQKQLTENGTGEFITVNAGYNPSLSGFLQDISAQLCSIFKKNGFWVHGNDALKGYVRHIESLMRSARYTNATEYVSHIFSDSLLDLETHKEECNTQIVQFCEQHKKRIYIIIDDIDRSSEAERELFFDVMRQCLSLRYCRVFFLADYETLQTKRLTKAYMEKYINRRIVLDRAGFAEIVACYLPEFFPEPTLSRLEELLSKQVRTLKAALPQMEAEISKLLTYSLQSMSRLNASDKPLSEEQEKKKATLEKIIQDLEGYSQNPRKVKRFLFEFLEKRIYLAQNCWFSQPNSSDSDYSGLDWGKTLASLSFIECFLPEEYARLEQCTSIFSYRSRFPEDEILPLLFPELSKRYEDDTKLHFLNMLVFGLYRADPRTDRSVQLQCLHEMRENFDDTHIGKYLSCCSRIQTNFSYPRAMLDWLESPVSRASTERMNAILHLANTYASQYYPDSTTRFEEYLSVLRRIRCLLEELLTAGSEEAKKAYQICCANLEDHLIAQMHFDFSMLLPVLYHEPWSEKTPENFQSLNALKTWLGRREFLWPPDSFDESQEDIEVVREALRRVNKQIEIFYADEANYSLLAPAVPELYRKRLARAVSWLTAWEERPELSDKLKKAAVPDRKLLLSSYRSAETTLKNLSAYAGLLANTGAKPELWEGQDFAHLVLQICGQYPAETLNLTQPETEELIGKLREISTRVAASEDCATLLQTPEWCNGQMYLYRLADALLSQRQSAKG